MEDVKIAEKELKITVEAGLISEAVTELKAKLDKELYQITEKENYFLCMSFFLGISWLIITILEKVSRADVICSLVPFEIPIIFVQFAIGLVNYFHFSRLKIKNGKKRADVATIVVAVADQFKGYEKMKMELEVLNAEHDRDVKHARDLDIIGVCLVLFIHISIWVGCGRYLRINLKNKGNTLDHQVVEDTELSFNLRAGFLVFCLICYSIPTLSPPRKGKYDYSSSNKSSSIVPL